MGKIFTDLAYNNKTLKPIGRPVGDLKALYKDKAKDYTYVVDSLNKTETLLNNLPTVQGTKTNTDEKIVENAKNVVNTASANWQEQGDLENRVMDTKKLANDLTNKYGLMQVQQNAKAQATYEAGLKEQLDKGDITDKRYKELISYSRNNYKGVTQDPKTGVFTGSYNGRASSPMINIPEKYLEIAKGWKADTITLKDEQGRTLQVDPSGKGYLVNGKVEQVTQDTIIKALKAYMRDSSTGISAQMDEDLFLEMDGIGDITQSKLKSVIKNGSSSLQLLEQLGIDETTISNLEKVAEDNNMTKEQLYKVIRKDQMNNDAMIPAIEKESYFKETKSYLKDWKEAARIKKADELSLTSRQKELLHTYDNEQNYGINDIKNTAKIVEDTKDYLKKLKLNKKQAEDTNDIVEQDRINKEIENQTLVLNDIEEQQQVIFDAANMDSYFEKVKNIQEYEGFGKVDITKSGLRKLIYANLNDTLTDEDIKANITFLTKSQWEDKNTTRSEQDLSPLYSSYEDYVKGTTKILKNMVQGASKTFSDKIEKSPRDYVKKYNTILFDDMTPKQQSNHALYPTWNMLKKLPTTDIFAFKGMSSVNTNIDVKTQIEQDYDLGKNSDKIIWKTATYTPTFDYRLDRKQRNYRPTVMLQVDIVTGKKGAKNETKRIEMPVFYDNSHYEKLFNENLTRYRKELIAKDDKQPLSESDQMILDAVELNLYNKTEYGKAIDLKNLHNVSNNSDTPIRITKGLTRNVRTYTNNSPTGLNFYLTEGTGEDAIFFAYNKNGDVTKYKENPSKLDLEEGILDMKSEDTKRKVANGSLSFVGGNTVRALKTTFASMSFNYKGNTSKTTKDNKNNYTFVDIANDPAIRLSPTNTYEQTKINKEVYEDVVNLFETYPNIIATDVSRNTNTNVSGSVENSNHKLDNGGKSLDLRANGTDATSLEAIKISKLSDREKRKLGIEKAFLHGKGNNLHLHIKFI